MSGASSKPALYPVPDDVFAQHSAWLATSGAGKTTAVKGGVERMLDRGERVVVIDPTGVWWGLRFRADGRSASPYKVVIFGREHADLPLEEGSGEAIAQALGTSSTSAILSLKGMRVAERTRFITGFFETLVDANSGALNLVIDEIHLFAPQSGGSGLTPAMLHATNNLVSLGRSSGLRIAMISQRPAKVHKDSLTQAKALVALQCSHPLDQRPVRDWLSTSVSDKATSTMIMQSLAGLPVGAGWLSAPQLGILEQVQFPMIATFDSSRAGAAQIPLKPLDVAALREALAASVSPPTDRSKKGSEPPAPERPASADEIGTAKQNGYAEGFAAGALEGARQGWSKAMGEAREAIGSVSDKLELRRSLDEKDASVIIRVAAVGHKLKSGRLEASELAPVQPSGTPAAGGLSDGERKLVAAMDTMDDTALSWAAVALRAGYVASGGGFRVARRNLVARGLVEERDGKVSLVQMSAFAPVPTREILVEQWASLLPDGSARLLRALPTNGDAIATADLATATGYAATGGGFRTAIKKLRTSGLVELDGKRYRLSPPFLEATNA